MAVTSIWRVHGRIGKVLDYVENTEKTTAVSSSDGDLSDVIDYAIQQRKTSQTQVRDGEKVVQRFVSGINCHPNTAKMEMQKIKKFYGKEDGVIAYHGYQSFAPGEATPEIAHEIGIKLAQQLWGDRYQVLVATHLDRANHLHSHFVINTVSFGDGIEYRRTKEDYQEMRRVSDALCREYGKTSPPCAASSAPTLTVPFWPPPPSGIFRKPCRPWATPSKPAPRMGSPSNIRR